MATGRPFPPGMCILLHKDQNLPDSEAGKGMKRCWHRGSSASGREGNTREMQTPALRTPSACSREGNPKIVFIPPEIFKDKKNNLGITLYVLKD